MGRAFAAVRSWALDGNAWGGRGHAAYDAVRSWVLDDGIGDASSVGMLEEEQRMIKAWERRLMRANIVQIVFVLLAGGVMIYLLGGGTTLGENYYSGGIDILWFWVDAALCACLSTAAMRLHRRRLATLSGICLLSSVVVIISVLVRVTWTTVMFMDALFCTAPMRIDALSCSWIGSLFAAGPIMPAVVKCCRHALDSFAPRCHVHGSAVTVLNVTSATNNATHTLGQHLAALCATIPQGPNEPKECCFRNQSRDTFNLDVDSCGNVVWMVDWGLADVDGVSDTGSL